MKRCAAPYFVLGLWYCDLMSFDMGLRSLVSSSLQRGSKIIAWGRAERPPGRGAPPQVIDPVRLGRPERAKQNFVVPFQGERWIYDHTPGRRFAAGAAALCPGLLCCCPVGAKMAAYRCVQDSLSLPDVPNRLLMTISSKPITANERQNSSGANLTRALPDDVPWVSKEVHSCCDADNF